MARILVAAQSSYTRAALGYALIAALLITATAQAAPESEPRCTATEFRSVARNALQPWWLPASAAQRATMRRLISCAPNRKTRAGMRRTRERLEAGKARAVAGYRRLTPYTGLGARWAIPAYIVACESGGSWSAANPSGAIGAYQFLGWPVPWPVDSFQDKLAHHRQAAALSLSNWVCA